MREDADYRGGTGAPRQVVAGQRSGPPGGLKKNGLIGNARKWLFAWVRSHPKQAASILFAFIYVILAPVVGLNYFIGAQKFICSWIGPRLGCPDLRASDREEVPRRTVYNRQLERFKVATQDADSEFLDRLEKDGFRLNADDVCLGARILHERAKAGALPSAAIAIVIKSAQPQTYCENNSLLMENGKNRVSFDKFLLDLAIGGDFRRDEFGACAQQGVRERFEQFAAAIDLLIAVRGGSQDLIEGARGYLDLLQKIERAERSRTTQACARLFTGGFDAWDLRFASFIRGCEKGDTKKTRLFLYGERWEASASTQRETKAQYIARNSQRYCDGFVPEAGWSVLPNGYKPALERWARN